MKGDKMKSRQSDKEKTMQVRIDKGWHKIQAHLRAEQRVSIKSIPYLNNDGDLSLCN